MAAAQLLVRSENSSSLVIVLSGILMLGGTVDFSVENDSKGLGGIEFLAHRERVSEMGENANDEVVIQNIAPTTISLPARQTLFIVDNTIH